MEEHEGQTPSFTMELVQRFVRPLERQVMEGVLIQQFKGDFLINRRGEWGQNLPPNFTTAFEDRERGVARNLPNKRGAEDSETELRQVKKLRFGDTLGEVRDRSATTRDRQPKMEDPEGETRITNSGDQDSSMRGSEILPEFQPDGSQQGAKPNLGGKPNKITKYFGLRVEVRENEGLIGGSVGVSASSGCDRSEIRTSVISEFCQTEETPIPEEGCQVVPAVVLDPSI